MDKKPLFPVKGGILFQKFGDSKEFYLREFGLTGGHNGADIVLYHGVEMLVPEDGWVYKVYDLENGSVTKGFGVCMIGDPDENGFCNVWVFWHTMSNIKAKIGDRVKKGQLIAYMGASGQVYSNNIAVPDELKGVPPYPGTHLHLGKMLVRRTKEPVGLVLLNINGIQYVDGDGFYYEVQNRDNGCGGYIDPMLSDFIYELPKELPEEKPEIKEDPVKVENLQMQVSLLQKVVELLRKLLKF